MFKGKASIPFLRFMYIKFNHTHIVQLNLFTTVAVLFKLPSKYYLF